MQEPRDLFPKWWVAGIYRNICLYRDNVKVNQLNLKCTTFTSNIYIYIEPKYIYVNHTCILVCNHPTYYMHQRTTFPLRQFCRFRGQFWVSRTWVLWLPISTVPPGNLRRVVFVRLMPTYVAKARCINHPHWNPMMEVEKFPQWKKTTVIMGDTAISHLSMIVEGRERNIVSFCLAWIVKTCHIE